MHKWRGSGVRERSSTAYLSKVGWSSLSLSRQTVSYSFHSPCDQECHRMSLSENWIYLERVKAFCRDGVAASIVLAQHFHGFPHHLRSHIPLQFILVVSAWKRGQELCKSFLYDSFKPFQWWPNCITSYLKLGLKLFLCAHGLIGQIDWLEYDRTLSSLECFLLLIPSARMLCLLLMEWEEGSNQGTKEFEISPNPRCDDRIASHPNLKLGLEIPTRTWT